MKIVGQAPARSGDGRPFTGYSGRRLCELMGLINYDALASRFDLMNLLSEPMGSRGRGDLFNIGQARVQGRQLVREWAEESSHSVAIACGHAVFQCLTGARTPFFKGKTLKLGDHRVEVWNFPHPSATSAFWNDPQNVEQARRFLLRLLNRYGIVMA